MFAKKKRIWHQNDMQVIADNKITKLRQRHGIQRRRLVAIIARHSQETLATQRLSKDNATQRGILTRFDASREELARKGQPSKGKLQ